MKKFLKNIILFSIVILIIGEITVRVTYAVCDIPQRTIDKFGIQKYLPNQEGYWVGGDHKWVINALGWPGELPKSFDDLIVIIGDSYIENFMNPNEYRQSVLLKKNINKYNFMEAGRSGVSLIEAMEISKQLDSLKPIQTLVYVNDNDFYESIREIKALTDITQLQLDDKTIVYGKMKSPKIKKILYNWKLLYYLYNRFPLTSLSGKAEDSNKQKTNVDELKSKNKVFELLYYIKDNYDIRNKTLVFHPNMNMQLIEKCKSVGFNVIILDSNEDNNWTFDYDSHWTYYGHERAAQQVADALLIRK